MVAFYPPSRNMFHNNQAVAVIRNLPWGKEVIAITKVKFVGNTMIGTFDGRFFDACDGESMSGRQRSYLEPATFEHLAAVRWSRTI